MADAELMAAAKRLVGWTTGLPTWADHIAWKVANAYLAEHPTDDDEDVTEDWLLETGWKPVEKERPDWDDRWSYEVCVQDHEFGMGKTRHWLVIHAPCDDGEGNRWWAIDFWQQHEDDAEPDGGVALLSWIDRTTKGHVRRLIQALRPRKETP